MLAFGIAGCADGENAAEPAAREVFRVDSRGGGWERAAFGEARSPDLALFDDGRVLFVEPERVLGSGPPRYLVAQADPAEVAEFVDDVVASGLVRPETEVGAPTVTDQPTTTITVGADAPTTLALYAFDPRFEDDLDEQARERRRHVRDVLDRARSFADGEATDYVPDRVVVHELDLADPPGAEPPVWIGPDPDSFLVAGDHGRVRGELAGEEAATVYRSALDNPTAVWRTESGTRALLVDPVP